MAAGEAAEEELGVRLAAPVVHVETRLMVVDDGCGEVYQQFTTYNVQQFTEIVYTRIRGRQMALRIESNDLGVAWQLGVPRMDVRPDGRR